MRVRKSRSIKRTPSKSDFPSDGGSGREVAAGNSALTGLNGAEAVRTSGVPGATELVSSPVLAGASAGVLEFDALPPLDVPVVAAAGGFLPFANQIHAATPRSDTSNAEMNNRREVIALEICWISTALPWGRCGCFGECGAVLAN
jgi:hypothetical protein